MSEQPINQAQEHQPQDTDEYIGLCDQVNDYRHALDQDGLSLEQRRMLGNELWQVMANREAHNLINAGVDPAESVGLAERIMAQGSQVRDYSGPGVTEMDLRAVPRS